MRIEHTLPADLFVHRPVRILVVGAGGTGSAILMGLPYLDQAMRVWGHPYGLDVVMMDADTVSETNCVRQPFSVSDIGQNKATVLINRINLFWGTKWLAEPTSFDERRLRRGYDTFPDLLIGCVDTRAARKTIDQALTQSLNGTAYWLDLGNNAASGQYVLGQPLNSRNRRKAGRLRTVSELYPEITDIAAGEDPLPSCSAIEALDRQEPYINQTLASSALAMLSRLFRYGKLTHHGAFFNAETGQMTALPVDPVLWAKTRKRSRRQQPKPGVLQGAAESQDE
ncbi:MAG: PRTRC system ThiF family protein [Acidobacteriaceae bacterium]